MRKLFGCYFRQFRIKIDLLRSTNSFEQLIRAEVQVTARHLCIEL
ncbi:hypothetical protein [Mycoavidus sp. B2-EB]|nr:hypothetical protein [Mycoavidus sp. B2-EB]